MKNWSVKAHAHLTALHIVIGLFYTAPMRLYSTLSRKKEVVSPIGDTDTIRLFVCGPTLYDEPHIGNARTYIVFDSLVKFLRSERIHITYVQNLTDIDDKIIARAKKLSMSPAALAEKYRRVYMKNMRDLNVTAVDTYAPATKHIRGVVSQIQKLLERGNAYLIPGFGYYFDTTTFPHYGDLSRRTTVEAEDGVSRIDDSIKKRNKADFCLWKFSVPGEPSWKTPLGDGRPGWHIEDTAISEHYFGPQYELHGGALDLKFPHHEAEIAQQEAASGKRPFVSIWLHSGLLSMNSRKMAKSVGNIISVDEYLAAYSARAFRLLVLSHHYRSPIDFSEKLARDMERAVASIEVFLAKLEHVMQNAKARTSKNVSGVASFEKAFIESLRDDFNTPQAIAAAFKLISSLSPAVWSLTKRNAAIISESLKSSLSSLGLGPFVLSPIPRDIAAAVKNREKYRHSEQFMQSDGLRKKVEGLGYLIEDTPLGPFVCKKSPL